MTVSYTHLDVYKRQPELLIESGLVKKELNGIKILGEGALEKKLTVKANKFSKSAVAAIENAGGKAEVI